MEFMRGRAEIDCWEAHFLSERTVDDSAIEEDD
jgi:hypothetical protein